MTAQGYEAEDLRRYLKPMVAMFAEMVNPKKNELTQNQAFAEYGRTWIEKQQRNGDLKARYKGGRKIFSRADIECLIAVEKTQPAVFIK